jgi:hypothetical protein
MLKDLQITPFKQSINYSLVNNITKETSLTLASLLALDYLTRLNSSGLVEEYANICTQKLKNFLGLRVIIDSEFSTSLMLFSVAISPDTINYHDKNNILNQDKSQYIIISTIIAIHFSEHSVEEKGQIKLILKDLFNHAQDKDVVNLINSEPKIIKAIINNALRLNLKQQEINEYVQANTTKILNSCCKLDNKTQTFKQRAAGLATFVSTLLVAAVSVVIATPLLPILIIPITLGTIKYAPKIGERIAQNILNQSNDIKNEKHYIQKLKNSINIVTKNQNLEKQQTVAMKVDTPKILQNQNVKLNVIKEQLKEYTTESKGYSVSAAGRKNEKVKGRLV